MKSAGVMAVARSGGAINSEQGVGIERAEADEELRARAVGVRATRLVSVSVSVRVSVRV